MVTQTRAAGSVVAYLRLSQEVLWLLLAILPARWVNLWGQQPFELPKALLVRSPVWLLAGLALVEWLVARRSQRRQLHPNPLLGPTAVLAAVLLVPTVTSADRSLSLWVSYEGAERVLNSVSRPYCVV
jgi:hypothetical protein